MLIRDYNVVYSMPKTARLKTNSFKSGVHARSVSTIFNIIFLPKMQRTSTLLTVINAITSNQMKHDNGSCDRNFANCVTKPEKKFRTSTGIKTRELVKDIYVFSFQLGASK